MPFMSREEKLDNIKMLRDSIENKTISPGVFIKFKVEADRILRLGREDFIVIHEYSTDFKNGQEKGRIRPAENWDNSDKGFKITAESIPDLLDTIAYILDTNPSDLKFYITCDSPDIGYPRFNGVETMLDETRRNIAELEQPGEYVLDTFYDG